MAFGSAVCASREACEEFGLFVSEDGAFVRVPGEVGFVVPDEEGGVTWYDAEVVIDGYFEVSFAEDGDIHAEHMPDVALEWPRSVDEVGCDDGGQRAGVVCDVDRAYPFASRIDADQPPADEANPMVTGTFEHVHAELLGAEPAAASGV